MTSYKSNGATICQFIFDFTPMPWQRAGKNGKFSYTPPKMKNHQNLIKHVSRKIWKELPSTEALKVEMIFYFEKPKSNKKSHVVKRPDLDNLVKMVADAMNKLVWVDDSQIIELTAKKVWTNGKSCFVVNVAEIL